jgi:flagellar biosynthesis/type III secretory pathway M-ring protein FliF/YscJ
MDYFWSVVWAVAPTILVGLVFWFIMWTIIRIDRHERNALAKVEGQERARLARRSPTS